MVKRFGASQEVPLTDVEFGVSQVLPVLVLCYTVPPGSTVILEQPEIHLHPSAQSALADVFIDAIENRGIQLVLESHSEHLLRRLQRRIAEKALSPDKTRLFFCDIDGDVSRIDRPDIDMFGNIRNWPQNFFGDMVGDMLHMLDATALPEG